MKIINVYRNAALLAAVALICLSNVFAAKPTEGNSIPSPFLFF